jgi:NAD(P)-dependent dehydrogenase (short-subunit alcohol dehydrogenase family)
MISDDNFSATQFTRVLNLIVSPPVAAARIFRAPGRAPGARRLRDWAHRRESRWWQVDLQLNGRRALVTGGSRGIGKAAAAALLAEGAEVAIAARDLARLTEAAAELGAAAGRAVPVFQADTGDDASARQLVAAAQDRLGGVDILVNCAARPAGQAPPLALAEITSEAFWSDVNVKVMGYLRCAQAVAPAMVEAGWGRIISVSGLAALSTGSVIGSVRNVAVSAMTKNLADELGPSGVNVNAVHPGLTRTEATPGVIAAQAAAAGVEPAVIEGRLASRTRTRTIIDAAEVAAVIAFLASPLAVSVNGESIACGGGTPGVIHY